MQGIEVINYSIKKCKYNISNNRQFYMGVAMLLVVLYHCYCVIGGNIALSLFKRGYIGVDIFLFFSGLGLCYSYSNNSLKSFYFNRLWRILPMYWVWAIAHLAVYCIENAFKPSFSDVFGLFSMFSYFWGVGEIRSNWYLSALLCLYLLFPMIFSCVKRWKFVFLLLVLFSSATALYALPFEWYHAAFIGRLYIFTLGIIYYHGIGSNNLFNLYVLAVLIIAILGIVFLYYSSKFQFWGTSCFCPVVITVLSLFPPKIIGSRFVGFCGKYSLEIFIGNCWTMLLMQYCDMCLEFKIIMYFLSNVLFSFLLIVLNQKISLLKSKIQNILEKC